MVLIATDLPEPVVPATKQVGHAGQVHDHRVAADRLAERDRQAMVRLAELFAREKFAQIDGVAALVRQFDADGVAALNNRHTGRDRRHRAGDVVGKPNDPRRLDARRRLELVKGDDWTGAHVDDLALHAEIVEDPFKQARVLLQRVLRDFGADRFLRLRQHRDRGHDPFAARPGRHVERRVNRGWASGNWGDDGRRKGRERRRILNPRRERGGNRRYVVDVADRRPRCGWRGVEDGRGLALCLRAAGGHPAQRRPCCQQGMNDGADRHHAEARLVLFLFVVKARQRAGAGLSGGGVGGVVRGTRASHAGGGGEPEDSDRGKAGADGDRGPGRGRKEPSRERQESVADDPAESGGQRPAPGRGEQRSQPGRRDHASAIECDFQAGPLKLPLGDEAPAPERGRGEQGGRGKADELHHEIGGDCARSAEKIVDALVRRVIETGIADRPGQQREGQAGDARERDQASNFGRPPFRELPHRSGHMVDKRECRRAHRSLGHIEVAGSRAAPCLTLGMQS